MRANGKWLAPIVAAACLGVLLPDSLRAQEAGQASSETGTSEAGVRDVAFERYVDIDLLAGAWAKADAALLADVALQLAEGERILLRVHRSGITAERALETAARVATAQGDKATLERLAKAAKERGSQTLTTQLATSLKLSGEQRSDGSGAPKISVEEMSPQDFAQYRALLDAARAAQATGDSKLLSVIQEKAKAMKLTEEQRRHLEKQIEEARGAKSPLDDSMSQALAKLGSASRATGIFGIVIGDSPVGVVVSNVFSPQALQAGIQPGWKLRQVGGVNVFTVGHALYAKNIAVDNVPVLFRFEDYYGNPRYIYGTFPGTPGGQVFYSAASGN